MKTNTTVALKIFKNDYNDYEEEINNIKKVKSEYVIKVLDGKKGIMKKNDVYKETVYLVLEYVENGELFDFLNIPKKRFGEDLGRILFLNIINAVDACHKSGIVHRDLKLDNILFDKDFNIKICDFGLSKFDLGERISFVGTPGYRAPEIWQAKDKKIPYLGIPYDIFSCGVILFNIVTGKAPFRFALDTDEKYKLILLNDFEGFWKIFSIYNLSTDFKSLVSLMLTKEPTKRPSIDEIKNHCWMKKINLSLINELKLELASRKEQIDKNKEEVKSPNISIDENKKDNKKIKNRVNKGNEEKDINDKIKLENTKLLN